MTTAVNENGPNWELYKENAAPLERGRNAASLSRVLAKPPPSASKSYRKDEDKEVQNFEFLIRPSERFAELYAKNEQKINIEGNRIVQKSEILQHLMEECKLDADKDPLVHWLRYIKYHEETYPSDTHSQFLLMERCTRALLHHPLYTNDSRFVRVCILYADRTSEPCEIFKFFHQSKVGVGTAIFWMAWAWVVEKKGDFPFSEKIFKKGLAKKAKPIKILEERYKQFQRRMSRHWLNAASAANGGQDAFDAHHQEEDEQLDQENRRGALSGLTEHGVQYNHRSRGSNAMAMSHRNNLAGRTNNRNGITSERGGTTGSRDRNNQEVSSHYNNNGTSQRREESSTGAFSIYVEGDPEDNGGEYNLDKSYVHEDDQHTRMLTKEEDKKKENTLNAERWNERGGLNSHYNRPAHNDDHQEQVESISVPSVAQRWAGTGSDARMAGGTSAQPAFTVFVDEECASKYEKKASEESETKQEKGRGDDRSLRQRMDGGIAEKLAKDPLRYVKNPLKAISDKAKYKEKDKPLSKRLKESRPNSNGRDLSRYGGEGEENIKNQRVASSRNDLKRDDNKLSYGFKKHLLAKGSDGQERCFEEGRARSKFYRLVTPDDNFNMLEHEEEIAALKENSCMDVDDESSIEDVEMEEYNDSSNQVLSEEQHIPLNTHMKAALNSTTLQGSDSRSEIKAPIPRRVLFGLNTSIGSHKSNRAHNTSTNSSIVNEQDAVGVVGDREETINTKFAARELSMMFSSPATGRGKGEKISKSLIGSVNDSNRKLNNSETSIKPLFSVHGKKKQESRLKIDDCITQGSSAQDSKETGGGETFKIFSDFNQDNNNEVNDNDRQNENEAIQKSKARSKQINVSRKCVPQSFNHDSAKTDKNTMNTSSDHNQCMSPPCSADECTAGKTGFQIFCDNDSDNNKESSSLCQNNITNVPQTGFQIFCDDGGESNEENKNPVQNDKNANHVSEPFVIFQDEENESLPQKDDCLEGVKNLSSQDTRKKDNVLKSFAIFQDTENVTLSQSSSANKCADGETASLTEIAELMRGIESITEKKSVLSEIKPEELRSKKSTTKSGSDIFCDTVEKDDFLIHERKDDGTVLTDDTAAFGNLSLIEPNETDTTSFLLHQKVQIRPSSSNRHPKVIDYKLFHDKETKAALQKTMESIQTRHAEKSIFDCRQKSIPRCLRKVPRKGTEIEMGDWEYIVKHELGRGSYGIVLLCDHKCSPNNEIARSVALKVQLPTGCLAGEYEILNTLDHRLRSKTPPRHDCRQRSKRISSRNQEVDSKNDTYPFPRALSFVAFENGGVIGMTAGSNSGLNLVDIVNIHKGAVPELIAIYYTSRMLLNLELMHVDGNILHCDVKPDNWVLTSLQSASELNIDVDLPGSDLMLVDFGRSIDLISASSDGLNPLEVRFSGNIAAEDMECVAMREGRPWGIDNDLYGLCASAHTILFGIHMDVEKDSRSCRWKLKKSFRRYWQRDLWRNLFDTLLNAELGNGRNDAKTLYADVRSTRESFQTYLSEGNRQREIKSLLNDQARSLPNKR